MLSHDWSQADKHASMSEAVGPLIGFMRFFCHVQNRFVTLTT